MPSQQRAFLSFTFVLAASLGPVLRTTQASADPPVTATKDRCIDADAKAQPLRREGKLAAARAELALCINRQCPGMVRDDCAQRLDEINRAQPTIVFDAKDTADNDLNAVRVTVDGEKLAERLDGSPLPVDPGAHTFAFETPGQPPTIRRLVVREGEKGRIERIWFAGPPSAAAIPPAVGTPAATATTPSEPLLAGGAAPTDRAAAPTPSSSLPVEGGSHGGGAQRAWGLVLGSIGLGGVAVGTVYGLLAASAWDDSKNECSPGCPAQNHAAASSDHDRAVSDGTVSTVALIAGGAFLVGGIALFASAPGESGRDTTHAAWAITPSLGLSGGRLDLKGEF
jgi:hypothetical protein